MISLKRILPFFFIMYFVTSCNQGGDSKTTGSISPAISDDSFNISKNDSTIATDFCNLPGSGNFIIDPAEAMKMMDHFKEIYKKDAQGAAIPALGTTYWVNACVVSTLETFLNNNPDYDGVRLIFGALPQGTKATTLFIVPTKPVINSPTKPELNGHDDKWDVAIPGSNCPPHSFFWVFKDASPQLKAFAEFYRERANTSSGAKRDSLSEKVWIDRCVIKSLASILRQHPDKLDGINIEMAAYAKKASSAPKGQAYENQSTTILVTTKLDSASGEHRNVWAITKQYYNIIKRNKDVDSYNHGELCPNSCN